MSLTLCGKVAEVHQVLLGAHTAYFLANHKRDVEAKV